MIRASRYKADGKTTSWHALRSPSNWHHGRAVVRVEYTVCSLIHTTNGPCWYLHHTLIINQYQLYYKADVWHIMEICVNQCWIRNGSSERCVTYHCYTLLTPIPGSPCGPGLPASPVSPCYQRKKKVWLFLTN